MGSITVAQSHGVSPICAYTMLEAELVNNSMVCVVAAVTCSGTEVQKCSKDISTQSSWLLHLICTRMMSMLGPLAHARAATESTTIASITSFKGVL
jgi:hypothetical protein